MIPNMTPIVTDSSSCNILLASCPWGPVTANGVGVLTVMYVVFVRYVH